MVRPTTFALFGLHVLLSTALNVRKDHSLHKANDEMPKLTLPWGTWQGEKYGEDDQTTLFRNVRFGQAPVGPLRFAAPKYPKAKSNRYQVQDSNYGPSCIGVNPTDKKNVSVDPISSGAQSEDCLFVDVYVPSWVFEEVDDDLLLPVVVFFYGGAYIFGGKNATAPGTGDSLINVYDGRGIISNGRENVIWVVGNYRLGAYGFLAGSTIESHAQPNAGLHDQRLLLDWVQKYIGSVHGDKSDVSIWGSSAGAGSIMHHLTAYGGKKKDEESLFSRAALFSTAFQWAYDRKGTLEDTFQNFSKAADCSGSGAVAVECLRNIKTNDEKLVKANERIIQQRLDLGLFPFGPAVDGDLVPDLPAVSLKKGAKVPVKSLLLSHVFDEASLFLAKWVDSVEDFTAFLKLAFPSSSLSSVREEIEKQYPAEFFDFLQKNRMRSVIADSSFICNKRQLYNAYKDASTSVYGLVYELPPAYHGVDLFHFVWSPSLDMSQLFKSVLPDPFDFLSDFLSVIWAAFSQKYQTYLAGYAISGDPNALTSPSYAHWPMAMDDGDLITDQLRIDIRTTRGFTVGSDGLTSETVCNFWEDIAEKISNASAKDALATQKLGLFIQTDDEM